MNNVITIVSGLPRSGTSLMMKMPGKRRDANRYGPYPKG